MQLFVDFCKELTEATIYHVILPKYLLYSGQILYVRLQNV